MGIGVSEMIVVVPSRGRPHNIERLISEWQRTAILDTQLHVVVDADDPQLAGYVKLMASEPDFCYISIQSRCRGLNAILNDVGTVAAEHARIIGNMGDDHVPRTVGWDQLIVEQLQTTGVAYGDDLLQGEKLPTAAFLTSDLIQCLHYYAPPALTHLMIDVFWLELGRATRLVYLSAVVIEHMHSANGKAPYDDTYELGNSAATVAHDQLAWQAYFHGDGWRNDLAKLSKAGLR